MTRLEGPTTGIIIEGRFHLGWIGRLTPEQLEFVGVLVRNRMDDIAAVLGAPQESEPAPPTSIPAAQGSAAKRAILDRLATGELSFDEAMQQIRGIP